MIYLILNPVTNAGIDEINKLQGKNVPCQVILKIGYTEDGNLENHLKRYGIPGLIVLGTIDGGTEIHKKSLHKYFEKYKYLKLKEWFYYDSNIVDEFNKFTLSDLDKISNLYMMSNVNIGTNAYFKLLKAKFIPEVTYIYRSIYSKDFIERSKIESYLLNKTVTKYDVMNKLGSEFGKDRVDNILKSKDAEFNLIKDDLSIFNKITDFRWGMKYLCTTKIANLDVLLKFIPIDYSNYYYTLGPDRCRALLYQRDCLEKEYLRIKNNSKIDIDSLIYSEFKVGDKLTLEYIKSRLKSIYVSNSYDDVPKATEIENWFEVKQCKITVNKKRSRGFELIRKKK